MTLHLTPDNLAAAYDYLAATLPFKAWGLPASETVEFHVTKHRDREADHSVERRRDHCIRVSAYRVYTTDALMQAMAHELVHCYQDGPRNSGSRRVMHNAEFKRLAARVCRVHGWDEEKFT